jgi:hypothetical protein
MTRFRKLAFIRCNGEREVHSSLLTLFSTTRISFRKDHPINTYLGARALRKRILRMPERAIIMSKRISFK